MTPRRALLTSVCVSAIMIVLSCGVSDAVVPRDGDAYQPGTVFKLPKLCPRIFGGDYRQQAGGKFFRIDPSGRRHELRPQDRRTGRNTYRWLRGYTALQIWRRGPYVAERKCYRARRGNGGPLVIDVVETDTRSFAVGCEREGRGYCVVAVRLATFIPSPAIAAPFSLFGADDRGFSAYSDRARSIQVARIALDPRREPLIDPVERQFGPSKEYDTTAGVEVAGRPSWWRALASAAVPVCSERLAATESRLRVEATQQRFGVRSPEDSHVGVRLTVAGSLPACASPAVRFFAPAIDAEIVLHLRQHKGEIPEYKVKGKHDGFPAYELYLDSGCAYSFDPVTAASTPSRLAPPMDVRVPDTGWREVVAGGPCAPAGASSASERLSTRAGGAALRVPTSSVGLPLGSAIDLTRGRR